MLFVIRTTGNPLVSRTSTPLLVTTVAVVVVGLVLPATPFASVLGFTTLPRSYFIFLMVATPAYLALVEIVKRVVVGRLAA